MDDPLTGFVINNSDSGISSYRGLFHQPGGFLEAMLYQGHQYYACELQDMILITGISWCRMFEGTDSPELDGVVEGNNIAS